MHAIYAEKLKITFLGEGHPSTYDAFMLDKWCCFQPKSPGTRTAPPIEKQYIW